MNLVLTFELISLDQWDEPSPPIPEGVRMVRTISGWGRDNFAVVSGVSESLPFGVAVDILVSEHLAAREIAERERAKG